MLKMVNELTYIEANIVITSDNDCVFTKRLPFNKLFNCTYYAKFSRSLLVCSIDSVGFS